MDPIEGFEEEEDKISDIPYRPRPFWVKARENGDHMLMFIIVIAVFLLLSLVWTSFVYISDYHLAGRTLYLLIGGMLSEVILAILLLSYLNHLVEEIKEMD